jgi:hypothetical protein
LPAEREDISSDVAPLLHRYVYGVGDPPEAVRFIAPLLPPKHDGLVSEAVSVGAVQLLIFGVKEMPLKVIVPVHVPEVPAAP